MQVSVQDGTRCVRQWGTSLGEIAGHAVEEVDDETFSRILAALPGHGGGVALSEDHAVVTPNDEPDAAGDLRSAREAAAVQRQADLAVLAGGDDDKAAALARLLNLPA